MIHQAFEECLFVNIPIFIFILSRLFICILSSLLYCYEDLTDLI